MLSNPWAKSIPSSPNAGINILIPIPADRFDSKGLKFLKLLYPFPDSKNVRAKIDADGLRVIGYLNSAVNLL
jgi:hypothetical protein